MTLKMRRLPPIPVYLAYIVSVYCVSTTEDEVIKSQIVKWGNSLAVRIPKSVSEAAVMKEGDAIVIKAAKGRIELQHAERIPTLEQLVAQITPKNRYDETDWGDARGRETVEW